jgi:hypothetical protein
MFGRLVSVGSAQSMSMLATNAQIGANPSAKIAANRNFMVNEFRRIGARPFG